MTQIEIYPDAAKYLSNLHDKKAYEQKLVYGQVYVLIVPLDDSTLFQAFRLGYFSLNLKPVQIDEIKLILFKQFNRQINMTERNNKNESHMFKLDFLGSLLGLSPLSSINRKKCLQILQKKFNFTIRIFKLSSDFKYFILDEIFKADSHQLEPCIDILYESKENIYLPLMNRELTQREIQSLNFFQKNSDFQHFILSNHKQMYDDYLDENKENIDQEKSINRGYMVRSKCVQEFSKVEDNTLSYQNFGDYQHYETELDHPNQSCFTINTLHSLQISQTNK